MRFLLPTLIVLLATTLVSAGDNDSTTPSRQLAREIEVDFSQTIGTIRNLHGVNCGPIAENFTLDLSAYFRELRIPDVRLCAPNWPGTDCVEINLVFPDWDADADDPRNYDFEKTDDYIAAIRAVGARPLYSLGYTAERDVLGNKYKVHNRPPRDYNKWARICVNIVRHYNDGWANGHHWNIEYWEIWNEPDAASWWTGTVQEFARFYAIVAKTLKDHDPHLKVGGPALCCRLEWLDKFLPLCRQHGAPMDFCSWHLYNPKAIGPVQRAVQVEAMLKKYGFEDTENILDEWSPMWISFAVKDRDPLKTRKLFERTGGIEGGAFDVSALIFLQDSPVDRAMFYSGDTLRWSFIDRNGAPKKSYFAWKAYVQMLDFRRRVLCQGEDKDNGLGVLAGLANDGRSAAVLISNHQARFNHYVLTLKDLPWSGETISRKFVTDAQHDFQLVNESKLDATDRVQLSQDVAIPSVFLIQLEQVRCGEE